MNRRCFVLAAMIPLLGVPAFGQAKKEGAKTDARLIVEDGAGMFTADAIKKAKGVLGELKGQFPLEMTVMTDKEVPASKADEFKKLEGDARKKFFNDWAIDEAKSHKARGVFVLVVENPGHVQVLADRQIRDKGFTSRDEKLVVDMLMYGLRNAKDKTPAEQTVARDGGLLAAVDFVHDAYLKMIR